MKVINFNYLEPQHNTDSAQYIYMYMKMHHQTPTLIQCTLVATNVKDSGE